MRALRRCSVAAAVVATLLLAVAPVVPAAAQTTSDAANDTPDLVPVAVWTAVTVLLVLAVVGIGYLYRRENGLDRPLKAPPIDPIATSEAHDTTRDAAGHELPEHALEAHAIAGHDDATQQAEHLVQRGHG